MPVFKENNEPFRLASLLEPGALTDPSPLYRRLLAERPFVFDEPLGGWVVSRYADVVALLRDPRLLRDRDVEATMASLSEADREALRPLFGAYGRIRVLSQGRFRRLLARSQVLLIGRRGGGLALAKDRSSIR
jgi:cytochrome P450